MSNQLPSPESIDATGDARLPYVAPTLVHYGSLFVTGMAAEATCSTQGKRPSLDTEPNDLCDTPDGHGSKLDG